MTEHLKEEREEAVLTSRGKEFPAKGTASAQIMKGSDWVSGEQLGSQGDLEQMNQGEGGTKLTGAGQTGELRASPAALRALTILSREAT